VADARTSARGEDEVLSLRGLMPSQIDRILELARVHLGMDLAFVSRFEAGRQVHLEVSGDPSFGIAPGESAPLEDTYCQRMVDGLMPSAVPDTAEEAAVATLPATHRRRIGAYIGIPVHLSDGTLFGSFCCISHTPERGLDDQAVRFLSMLGALVADEFEDRVRRDADRRRLQQLVDDRSLTVALQPIVSVEDRRCSGLEALSRFPEGWGPPQRVFGHAKDVGLATELEELAVTRACELLPRLNPAQYLSVNLSPDAAARLAERLARDYSPVLDRLVVEVTEHAVVTSYDTLRTRLAPLRARGLRLAIDDMGAGFSSLQHLVELEPDIIKIDRSLTHGLATDHVRQRVFAAFTTLATELDALVIAEGVERPDDLSAAEELEADAIQGYVFAPPSTADADHRRWAAGHPLALAGPAGG
jgi:EAL domain-containing protein (putative c-di-GMP-specific phosphodiesterase class I)